MFQVKNYFEAEVMLDHDSVEIVLNISYRIKYHKLDHIMFEMFTY